MFTFSLINIASGDALGPVVYARRDWRPGELIAPGTLRVVGVIEPITGGLLPLLLVEPAEVPPNSDYSVNTPAPRGSHDRDLCRRRPL